MLWLNPGLARGVLTFLSRASGDRDVARSAIREPGKIMHETRKGEMAVLRELPFGRYYGGVDTTPLYIYLAAPMPTAPATWVSSTICGRR